MELNQVDRNHEDVYNFPSKFQYTEIFFLYTKIFFFINNIGFFCNNICLAENQFCCCQACTSQNIYA